MEVAKKIWHDTLRDTKANSATIVIFASISDIWKNQLNTENIHQIKEYGNSLGFYVEVEQGNFNWLVIKNK